MSALIGASQMRATVPGMTPRRNILLAPVLAVPMIALAIAGCGGSSSNASASPSTAAATTVNMRSSGLGKIVVDSKGRTLYLFEKDTGTKSTCSGACAAAWPPFTTSGKPKAGSGVTASLLGTSTRSDGKVQVTYNGHPLYYYAGDQKVGDTNGQNLDQFGAEWYVVSPAGKKVENSMAQANTSSSSRGY
jgi:predicted lipoprotein with Yx(FWY)xxD motif